MLIGANGKKSACNAEDTRDSGSIPGLGRFPGVGNGNPLQDSWESHGRGTGGPQLIDHKKPDTTKAI